MKNANITTGFAIAATIMILAGLIAVFAPQLESIAEITSSLLYPAITDAFPSWNWETKQIVFGLIGIQVVVLGTAKVTLFSNAG